MSVAASSSSCPPDLGGLVAAAAHAKSEPESPPAKDPLAINVIIPQTLLCRTDRLQKLPLDSAWLDFIRRPAVFIIWDSADKPKPVDTKLWSVNQRTAIAQVFAHGWKQKSPFVELFDAAVQQEEAMAAAAAAAAATAATAATTGIVKDKKRKVASKGIVAKNSTELPRKSPSDVMEVDVAAASNSIAVRASFRGLNLTLTPSVHPAIFTAVNQFARGPGIFHQRDLLTATNQQQFFQLIVASRGSFTGANTGIYGCDEYMHLIEGERLWYLAPAEQLDLFRALFDGITADAEPMPKQGAKKTVAVTKASKDHTKKLLENGVHAVHQKAGETIFIPGGWVRAIKNLSNTVTFGGYYLRAWNLRHTIAYSQLNPDDQRIDLSSIFQALEADSSNSGICQVDVTQILQEWKSTSNSNSNAAASSCNPHKRPRINNNAAAAAGLHDHDQPA